MVGEDVAGTDDHQVKARSQVGTPVGEGSGLPDAKLKRATSNYSKLLIWLHYSGMNLNDAEPRPICPARVKCDRSGQDRIEPACLTARPIVAGNEFATKSARFRSLIIQVGCETFGRLPRYLMRT
jgi:hypothetical protein